MATFLPLGRTNWRLLSEHSSDRSDKSGSAPSEDWPTNADGSYCDGTRLLELTKCGQGPFEAAWSVEAFVGEVEEILVAAVFDIPRVSRGANYYGLHIQFDNRADVIARLARHDANSCDVDSWREQRQRRLSRFELDTYAALQPLAQASQPHSHVFAGQPLHYREPVKSPAASTSPLRRSVLGRRLFLFTKLPGEGYDYARWRALTPANKSHLLSQSAQVAATLFQYRLPRDYASTWRSMATAGSDPLGQSVVAPTREFCKKLLSAKIEKSLAHAAERWPQIARLMNTMEQDLLWMLCWVLPRGGNGLDEEALYRFVLDHGDFGMHNMTVVMDETGSPRITSVYDWEAASIVPALLSEPKMVVTADLVVYDDGEPSVSRWGDGDSASRMDEYRAWTKEYYEELFKQSPEYQAVISASKDARRIWFTLRRPRAEESPGRLLELAHWARRKVVECKGKPHTSQEDIARCMATAWRCEKTE